MPLFPLAVTAVAAMLRVADRAQAGSQRLHGQADLTGRSPSLGRLRRRLFKGNQTAQSRTEGAVLRLENLVETGFRTSLENHFRNRFPLARCFHKESGVPSFFMGQAFAPRTGVRSGLRNISASN